MLKWHVVGALVGVTLLGTLPVAAQGIGHKWFMRGSIVGADKDGTIVCVGKADGAEVGQVLDVYRVYFARGPNKAYAPPYGRQKIGHVRIDHLFDDHFAHVTIVDGRPARNDIVELSRSH